MLYWVAALWANIIKNNSSPYRIDFDGRWLKPSWAFPPCFEQAGLASFKVFP